MRTADTDTPTLPEDPAALRALLLSVMAERDSLVLERDALADRNERLQHLLRKLQRMQFGPRSEQLPDDQLQFAFEDVEASIASTEAEAEQRSPDLRPQDAARRRTGRGKLADHLPRIEQVLLPESTACPCCRAAMFEIGCDTAERFDVIPVQFRVLVTKRPKFACRACAGVVVQAPAPARLIAGGMPTEAAVAHVVVQRYADHTPLYRQAQALARQGIEIGRDVLAGWMGATAFAVRPVVARMREILRGSVRLFADETTMPVPCGSAASPGRGKTKKGYAWAIARDDRPWGGTDPPAVVFHYAPGRGAEHARDLLAGYTGLLQCDGYGVYKTLAAPKDGQHGATLVYCWAHVRREFYDLVRDKTAPIAEAALRRIAALYAVEATIRGTSPELRRDARQARSAPLVADLFAWLEQQLARLPGGSTTAGAIRYALNHRDGLERFLDDGRAEINSNTVERAIRPLVLSHKNALFASGDDGGRRWADIASLVETCKMNGVNPQVYLTELLTRLANDWPQGRIDELMPWCWASERKAEPLPAG